MNMFRFFRVGDEIQGYCQGFFGRDDYEDKICVLVRPSYAVFEYENGSATVVNLSSLEGSNYDIKTWMKD